MLEHAGRGEDDIAPIVRELDEVVTGRIQQIGERKRRVACLELVEPGLVQVHKWRPDGSEAPGIADKDIAMYGAVARKA